MRPSLRRAAAALPLLLLGALLTPSPGPAASATSEGSAAAAAPLSRPNVVLVFTDDQTLGTLAAMPHLRAQPWVRFDESIVENALCCPSRATLLTGQYDTRTRVLHNGSVASFDARETLGTALQRRGYRTGHIGKYLNKYDGRTVPPGWDDWQVPYTPALYEQYDYPLSNNGRTESYGRAASHYQVDVLARKSVDFITTSAARREPFFLLFSPSANHTPWTASPARDGSYANAAVRHSPAFNEVDVSDKPAWIRSRPLRDVAKMTAARRAELEAAASVDDAVRRLDAALKTAGVYHNTVVLYTSDNGYALGDHRWVTKRCPYEACLRTPMLVRYPGVAAKTDRSHVISNIDIAPTVLAMTGATTTLRMDGRSFLPYVLSSGAGTTWRTGALVHWPGGDTLGRSGRPDSFPQFWGVRTDRDKYIELDTGEREYYDLDADPHEMRNQVRSPAYANRIEVLRSQLATLKRQAGASALPFNTSLPAPGETGPDLD